MSSNPLFVYPEAYIQYLIHFHTDRDFFECHEILEEYWKENPDDGNGDVWVGLIQLAVGLYHQRRGNLGGARKMLASSLHKLTTFALNQWGIDADTFISSLQSRLVHLEEGSTGYEDLNLPIADPGLLERCETQAKKKGWVWQTSSPMNDESIVQKHLVRDRSEVIRSRQAEIEKRAHRRSLS
ncbi:DUF309 domain-containing protein [Paenibacillus swuensis]|nr:DUF309 domain-containing protein [Paenibacillus swuensis]